MPLEPATPYSLDDSFKADATAVRSSATPVETGSCALLTDGKRKPDKCRADSGSTCQKQSNRLGRLGQTFVQGEQRYYAARDPDRAVVQINSEVIPGCATQPTNSSLESLVAAPSRRHSSDSSREITFLHSVKSCSMRLDSQPIFPQSNLTLYRKRNLSERVREIFATHRFG